MIMKKMYKQPIVETTGLIAGGQALCSSPQGIENGGNTEDLNIPTGKPIGD